jgi:hypothetical protein
MFSECALSRDTYLLSVEIALKFRSFLLKGRHLRAFQFYRAQKTRHVSRLICLFLYSTFMPYSVSIYCEDREMNHNCSTTVPLHKTFLFDTMSLVNVNTFQHKILLPREPQFSCLRSVTGSRTPQSVPNMASQPVRSHSVPNMASQPVRSVCT